MTLLDHYLRTVAMYLPKEGQSDILSELAEHLESKLHEREVAVGRSLTAVEQEAVLADYGSPMIVASRYGTASHGFTFGRRIIGPELFPMYLRGLLLVFALTIIVVPLASLFAEHPLVSNPLRIVGPLLIQFVGLTVIFASMDWLQRQSRRDSVHDHWRFPPAYLRPVPRWQSVSGFVCLALVSVWWMAVPRVPALVLGSAAGSLDLSPAWQTFYWPILAVLIVGIAQRAATLVRPTLNWLPPVTRLMTNGICLLMLYQMLGSNPFIVPGDGAAADITATEMARGASDWLWWTLLLGFGTYWLINVATNGWQCAQHARYLLRNRPGRSAR